MYLVNGPTLNYLLYTKLEIHFQQKVKRMKDKNINEYDIDTFPSNDLIHHVKLYLRVLSWKTAQFCGKLRFIFKFILCKLF